jgi:hypothetical protein
VSCGIAQFLPLDLSRPSSRELQRGTTCLSQEHPEEYDTPGNNQLSTRLGRVELLLERLLAKIEGQDDEEKAQKDLHTPESLGTNDVPTPFCSNVAAQDNIPLLSLFDNQVPSYFRRYFEV